LRGQILSSESRASVSEYRTEMKLRWLVKIQYDLQEELKQEKLTQLPSKSRWLCPSESRLVKQLSNQINFDLELSGGTSPWAKGMSGTKQEMFWRKKKVNGSLSYCSCYAIHCKKGLYSTEECFSQTIKQICVAKQY